MAAAEMFILIVIGLVLSAMAIRAYNTYRNVKALLFRTARYPHRNK
jgi:hypothetical protein